MVHVRGHYRRTGWFGYSYVHSHTRSRPRRRVFKRIILPPTNKKGIITYFRNRGYRTDPILQNPRMASVTFDKPLPDGSRVHGEAIKNKRKWLIKRHKDSYDPYRYPFKHLSKDTQVKHREDVTKIKRSF